MDERTAPTKTNRDTENSRRKNRNNKRTTQAHYALDNNTENSKRKNGDTNSDTKNGKRRNRDNK